MGKTFYTILIESEESSDEFFVQVFWTWAEHIGAAISSVLKVALQENIKEPVAAQIDPYDFESIPDNVYEIHKTGVFTSGQRYYYPATFCLKIPEGVILSALDGDFDIEDLHKGFRFDLRNDGFCRINVVLPQDELEDTFLQLVKALPSIKVSWVEILNWWDEAENKQLWTNERLNNFDTIADFLKSNNRDILKNGFLNFTVYCEVGATNLQISDHKEICLITRSQEIQRIIADKLKELKISESDNLKSLSKGFHHWHYRPDGSYNRNDFINHIKKNGFSFWKEIEIA